MRSILFIMFLSFVATANAGERSPVKPVPNSLFLRVIDTGSGNATLIVVTGETARDRKVMFHDVGHWNDDYLIRDELRHYIGRRKKVIDLVIVSHSDSDHLGASDTVLDYWKVQKHVRTGWERHDMRPDQTYWVFRKSLAQSVTNHGTEDYVMGSGTPALGDAWELGDAKVTFLSGFASLPEDWDVGVTAGNSRFESKARNAVSVVVRVDYAGRSILLPGDAVGKKDDADDGQVLGTEKFLVDNSGTRSIKADIVLAPHHGADNASSTPFIETVRPTWVIFSAGSKHKHPKFKTYKRYSDAGIGDARMLRTDRGDEKGRPTEWWGDWDDSCRDGHGDDGVSILIRKSTGEVIVDQDPPKDAAKGC